MRHKDQRGGTGENQLIFARNPWATSRKTTWLAGFLWLLSGMQSEGNIDHQAWGRILSGSSLSLKCYKLMSSSSFLFPLGSPLLVAGRWRCLPQVFVKSKIAKKKRHICTKLLSYLSCEEKKVLFIFSFKCLQEIRHRASRADWSLNSFILLPSRKYFSICEQPARFSDLLFHAWPIKFDFSPKVWALTYKYLFLPTARTTLKDIKSL